MSETLTGNRYFVSVILFALGLVCLMGVNDFAPDSRTGHGFLYAGLFLAGSAFLSVLIIWLNNFLSGGMSGWEVLKMKVGEKLKKLAWPLGLVLLGLFIWGLFILYTKV